MTGFRPPYPVPGVIWASLPLPALLVDLAGLIRISKRSRQRGVVILDNRHMRAVAHHGRPPRAVQRIVDVHRPPVGRTQIAELFHLFQQLHNPPGFLDNQVGHFAVFRG